MSALGLHPRWLAALRDGADQAPLRPRVPLWSGLARIGSVEPDFLQRFADLRQPGGAMLLACGGPAGSAGWQLLGAATAGLAVLARALHDAGLAGAWRDEQLAVCDEASIRLGTVERAAVRPLGIATRAVHLTASAPDGRVWVQQRSLQKANDPGLWDTLMGGMVSAADTLQTALERETWEEAGLPLQALAGLRYGGVVTTRRPAVDGGGAGYVIEDVHWYRAVVPDGALPFNNDGEVAQFALLAPHEIGPRLAAGAFTIEAALILAAAFETP